MSVPAETNTITDRIPDPAEIRERLAAVLREASLLRSLLRLSERAAKQRNPPVDPPAADAM